MQNILRSLAVIRRALRLTHTQTYAIPNTAQTDNNYLIAQSVDLMEKERKKKTHTF